jgi:hypothetical protein
MLIKFNVQLAYYQVKRHFLYLNLFLTMDVGNKQKNNE